MMVPLTFNAYPNVGTSLEGRYIMIDLVHHYDLSEGMFVEELEKTNLLLNDDVMDALSNEEVICSILY